ncbi:unnamed protein product [Merluccius merluccius]
MRVWLLLGLMALSSTGCFLVSAHMIPEDRLISQWNATEHSLSPGHVSHSPSIEIVGGLQQQRDFVEVFQVGPEGREYHGGSSSGPQNQKDHGAVFQVDYSRKQREMKPLGMLNVDALLVETQS